MEGWKRNVDCGGTIIKYIELYALNCLILWYVGYISIKLLLKKKTWENGGKNPQQLQQQKTAMIKHTAY